MPDRICSIDGCPNVHWGRGWCRMHYTRWRTHGDPLKTLIEYHHPPECSVDGCDRKIKAKGLCGSHYSRLRRTGTPELIERTDVERFWALFEKVDRCWEWRGHRNPRGYGYFKVGKRSRQTHRWAYETFVGPIPEGLQLDHLCHNPCCCNPAHLEPVTPRENTLRSSGPSALNAAKTHCHVGHPFDEANTMLQVTGARSCRACANANQNERRRLKRRSES